MLRIALGISTLLLALGAPAMAANLPAAGLSMKSVEQQFGSPIAKNAPVGRPPITRWEYNDFVVVFERSTVVHSVAVVRSEPANTPASSTP